MRQAVASVEQLKISSNVLEGITAILARLPEDKSDWHDADTDQQKTLLNLIAQMVDNKSFNGDGFLLPGFKNIGYLLWNWIMRNGSPAIQLDDKRVAELLRLFDQQVGQRARTIIIEYAAGTDIETWPARPISALSDYMKKRRDRDGISPELAKATLTLWGQQLLAEEIDQVLEEVMAQMPDDDSDDDPKSLQSAALAYRGIVLLASGFAFSESLLSEFSAQLRAKPLLGYNGTEALYQAGSPMPQAQEITRNYDDALSAAISALARLDILAGGDPLTWAILEETA